MNRREFSRKTKAEAFQRCGGKCEICTAKLMPGKFRYDHRLPDWFGGEPTLENCVVQCVTCDAPKTANDIRDIRKVERIRDKHTGAFLRTKRPFPAGRNSPWKQKLDGTIVPRHPQGAEQI